MNGISLAGFDPSELARIQALPEEQQQEEMTKLLQSMLGFSFDPEHPEKMLFDLMKLKQERDSYQQDLRILTRIMLDLGKIFGVVTDDDKLKNMAEESYGTVIFESLNRLLGKMASTKMPVIGKRYEKELEQQFMFVQALIPMAGKYQPATHDELKKMIEKGIPV